jgi:hypothetical protein
MIVDRWVWKTKLEHRDEFVELLKAEVERSARVSGRKPARICIGAIGPLFNTVVMELECRDLRDYEEGWAEWWADPESAEWRRRTDELGSEETYHEIWRVVD